MIPLIILDAANATTNAYTITANTITAAVSKSSILVKASSHHCCAILYDAGLSA
jgi:hypothetical protein